MDQIGKTYRTPLPGLLAALLDASVNRLLATDERSSDRLASLDGRVLLLELEGLEIDLWFRCSADRITVSISPGESEEADTIISGSPAALFFHGCSRCRRQLGRAGLPG